MTRTVFTTLTDRASGHLAAAAHKLDSLPPTRIDPGDRLEALLIQHADVTDALVHLGRTIRGKGPATRDRVAERLLQKLAEHAQPRSWSDPVAASGEIVGELIEAARCTRAAADLWTTHHTANGRPRSPEASQMRHPSMMGAALRHWRHLVGQSSLVAAALTRYERAEPSAMHRDVLAAYPTPPGSRPTLPPVHVPLARPTPSASTSVLGAIDDRVDRIHRHIWEVTQEQRMTAAILVNAAAIGMLLARSADDADARIHASRASGSEPECDPPARLDASGSITQRELSRWAEVAAAVAPVRTVDAPVSVLQVERLDLARLLERALMMATPPMSTASRVNATPPAAEVADRLWQASVTFRPVAALCATSIRALQKQGRLYLAGRQLPGYLFARRPDLVTARLTDQLVPAPTVVARRLEARLHAVASVQPSAGSAA